VLEVTRLGPEDREAWESLFRGYIAFYDREEPQSMYDRAWHEFRADERLHALGVKVDGALVGIVHFLVHASTSSRDVCYLQDLFTAPEARGHGVARALIDAVTAYAKDRDCDRVYWTTQTTNSTARALYDQVAEDRGFMVYRIPL
jgi:GNAT superfamily N-acetyltransferase